VTWPTGPARSDDVAQADWIAEPPRDHAGQHPAQPGDGRPVALAAATTTAFTTATPTTALLWPKLYPAQNAIESTLLGQAPASHLNMHPRRWLWMQSQVASTWPMIGAARVPPQMGGVILTDEYGPGIRGKLSSSGLRIVIDGNVVTNGRVRTNQDDIHAVAAAFTLRRYPGAVQSVTGTAWTAPEFA
jgi:hypothetical protein